MSGVALEIKLTRVGGERCLFVFERSPVIVGRGASCELCVPMRGVSAQHLALSWSEQGPLSARDLDAKNKAEHQGRPLTGEVSDPKRLTLALPGALIEARLIPHRAPGSSEQQRALNLKSLWTEAEGWLLEWRERPAPTRSADALHPSPEPEPETLKLVPLAFGERLELRAAQERAEGLPASLLKGSLSVESAPWGVSVTDPSGAQHRLQPGEELKTDEGTLTLPRRDPKARAEGAEGAEGLGQLRLSLRLTLLLSLLALCLGALYALYTLWRSSS